MSSNQKESHGSTIAVSITNFWILGQLLLVQVV